PRPGAGQCGVPGRSPARVVTMRRPVSLPHVVWLRSLVSCSGHDGEAECTVIMALFPSTLSVLPCCPEVTAVRDTLQEPANSAGGWARVDIHSTKVLSRSSTSTLTSHTKLCIVLPPLPTHTVTGQGATVAVGQEGRDGIPPHPTTCAAHGREGTLRHAARAASERAT